MRLVTILLLAVLAFGAVHGNHHARSQVRVTLNNDE